MKPKIRVLSIDWDYFVDASYLERFKYFPDGTTDTFAAAIQSIVWANRYAEHPKLQTFGLIEDFDVMCSALSHMNNQAAMMVCDSHSNIYDFVFNQVKKDEEIEVVNIDFHHDIYTTYVNHGEATAGDWALMLKKAMPHMSYKWVKRDDSEMPKKHISTISFEDALQKSYDIIFLCRSGAWSPPHLDEKFIEMANILVSKGPVLAESGIMEGREFSSLIEQFAENHKIFQEMIPRR